MNFINIPEVINIPKVGEEFSKYYYNKISTDGINAVFDLFHHDVICSIEKNDFKGAYNWLIFLTKQGIAKFEYSNITETQKVIADFIATL